MSVLGVNDVLGAYQYANRTQKTTVSGTSFTEQLQKTGETVDTSKAAHYEKIIDDFFASQPMVKAQMAAGGFEIQSYGVVIHPDGTANYYVCGDVSPEKKAKIEVQMKAEGEEKAKRKRRYQELSKEAAEKRKLEMELAYKRQSMTELLAKQTVDTSRVTYTATPEVMASANAAYENNIMGATGILQ